MFKLNNIYKHINCLDICFRVDHVEKLENEDFKLKGLWLNQHYDMMIICDDEIIVTKNKLHQWRILNEANDNSLG